MFTMLLCIRVDMRFQLYSTMLQFKVVFLLLGTECMTESEESEIRGVSLFHPAGSLEESEYQAMQPVDQLATHGGGGGSSGTEGSSYGSNSSSQALLTNVGATEEDKTSV